MITSTSVDSVRRRRRFHSLDFKISAVNRCLQPGVSVASVARQLDLNVNLLRQWVTDHERNLQLAGVDIAATQTPPTFVPVQIQPSELAAKQATYEQRCSNMEVNIDRGELRIQFKVDSSQIVELGQMLREVLR